MDKHCSFNFGYLNLYLVTFWVYNEFNSIQGYIWDERWIQVEKIIIFVSMVSHFWTSFIHSHSSFILPFPHNYFHNKLHISFISLISSGDFYRCRMAYLRHEKDNQEDEEEDVNQLRPPNLFLTRPQSRNQKKSKKEDHDVLCRFM